MKKEKGGKRKKGKKRRKNKQIRGEKVKKKQTITWWEFTP